jgi:hypothetical protein
MGRGRGRRASPLRQRSPSRRRPAAELGRRRAWERRYGSPARAAARQYKTARNLTVAPSSPRHHSGRRKCHSMPPTYTAAEPVSHHHHLIFVEPSSVYSSVLLALPPPQHQQSALAMLEDSVKRLKSPKASPRAMMPKQQADAALALLADWFLESSRLALRRRPP